MVAFVASTVLTAANLNTAFNALTIRTVTLTSDTLVLADNGGAVTYSNASATTSTIPPNSSIAYATGTKIVLVNLGAGVVTVTAGAGVTVNGSTLTLAQNAGGTCIKTATNTWSFLPFSSGSGTKATVSATTGSPTITTVGTRTVYKFTGAGSITTTAGEVEVLIVSAGSSSGGSDGNGGRIMTGTQTLTAATHTVAIGASGGTLSSVGTLSSGPSARALNSGNTTGAGGTTAVPGTPFTSSIDGTSRTYASGQSFGASSTTFGDGGAFAGVAFIAEG